MNTNGVLSFGRAHTVASSYGSNFSRVTSPPIIAPFWDDIDIRASGGTVYYRQDSDPAVAGQVQQAIISDYPEAESFQPSLVFVATWDRVEAFLGSSDLVNTFQVVVASDGLWTFVIFSYGDIQWGGSNTLIGISAGDRVNFITHPASFSSSVLSLDNTTSIYRVEGEFEYLEKMIRELGFSFQVVQQHPLLHHPQLCRLLHHPQLCHQSNALLRERFSLTSMILHMDS